MNSIKPENEFERTSGVIIQDGPEFTTIRMSGREFRIWAESADFGGDFDPAAIYKAGYEFSEKDFTPKQIILDKASLIATDGKEIEVQTASVILNHLIEYYKAQTLTVQVR